MTTNDANQTSPVSQISLLAHLAYKFGGQTETIATEALGYILSLGGGAERLARENGAPPMAFARRLDSCLRGNDDHGGVTRPIGTRFPPTETFA